MVPWKVGRWFREIILLKENEFKINEDLFPEEGPALDDEAPSRICKDRLLQIITIKKCKRLSSSVCGGLFCGMTQKRRRRIERDRGKCG